MKYVFGIDLGGTSVKMGFFTEDGKLLRKWEIPTDTSERGRHILSDISREIKKQCDMTGLPAYQIKGIGIGVPGPVSEASTVNRCAALGWPVTNVRDELEMLTGVRTVIVGNDANVAALGEMSVLDEKYSSGVMVTLGTGVGGGIIIDSKIVSGAFGAGGEIGHMCINELEHIPCNCGNYGCLEQYCSATGIVKTAERRLSQFRGESGLRNLERITAKNVFDLAKKGDGLSMVVVDESMKILGRALSLISAVIDPEVYIIGGGVSAAGTIITDTLKQYYREYAFHASENTPILLASLGNDAGIVGASRLVINK